MNKLLKIMMLAVPVCAYADGDAQPRLGDEVRAWTDLQKSGAASITESRPMPGEVADKVYDRYLQSFSHPIPQTFERGSFVGSSGSGSGSGSNSGGGSH